MRALHVNDNLCQTCIRKELCSKLRSGFFSHQVYCGVLFRSFNPSDFNDLEPPLISTLLHPFHCFGIFFFFVLHLEYVMFNLVWQVRNIWSPRLVYWYVSIYPAFSCYVFCNWIPHSSCGTFRHFLNIYFLHFFCVTVIKF